MIQIQQTFELRVPQQTLDLDPMLTEAAPAEVDVIVKSKYVNETVKGDLILQDGGYIVRVDISKYTENGLYSFQTKVTAGHEILLGEIKTVRLPNYERIN